MLALAAGAAPAGGDASGKTAWQRHLEAADSAAGLDREACLARGGSWEGQAGDKAGCELSTADGGKICRKGAECEIACVSRTDPRYSKNPFVIGECLRSTARQGCFFYVEGGRVAHAACRD